jgi:hypothetical protein
VTYRLRAITPRSRMGATSAIPLCVRNPQLRKYAPTLTGSPA